MNTLKTKRDLVRPITGWALLAAAVGILYDEFTCGGCAEGSLGLIPLYIGFPVGAVGLFLFLRREYGQAAAFTAAPGLAGILYFMFSYPNGAEGWIGAFLIGAAHLFLPLPARFAVLLWLPAGMLGFPGFQARPWGWIDAFLIFGLATAYTGAFALWGRRRR